MSKLICLKGMNKGDQFILHEGKNVIGRDREANIMLFDKQASRQHCIVVKKGRHYSVQDLESRNGTFLNKKPLAGKPLSLGIGDKIKIGKTVLQLSEKGVGGLIDQTANDVAADLQNRRFGRLLNRATMDVVGHQDQTGDNPNPMKRFFAKLLGR